MYQKYLTFVGCVCLISLILPGTVTGAPLLDEDWESGTSGSWAITEFWNKDVTLLNNEGYNSRGVLKLNIPVDEDDSEWAEYGLAGQQVPVYCRLYVRWSDNWKWSPVENKVIYINWLSSDEWRVNLSCKRWYPTVKNRRHDSTGTEVHCAPGELSLNTWYPDSDHKEPYLQNVGTYATNPLIVERGRWYGIEFMVAPNTPGQSNGALKMWIDGALVLDHQNVNVRGTSTNGIRRVFVSAYWNQVNPPAPHDYLNVWYDNITVDTVPIGVTVTDEIAPEAIMSVSD